MEADLARYYQGQDFRDFYRPKGGESRLTLRRLAVLVRGLPPESLTTKALGGSGFSTLELLVMESGIAGPVNPRHPWSEAEQRKGDERKNLLRERQAHYAAVREAQQAAGEPATPDES